MQYCNQLYPVKDRKPYTMLCRNQSVADEQIFAPVWLFLRDPSSAVTQLDAGVFETTAKDGWKAVPLFQAFSHTAGRSYLQLYL